MVAGREDDGRSRTVDSAGCNRTGPQGASSGGRARRMMEGIGIEPIAPSLQGPVAPLVHVLPGSNDRRGRNRTDNDLCVKQVHHHSASRHQDIEQNGPGENRTHHNLHAMETRPLGTCGPRCPSLRAVTPASQRRSCGVGPHPCVTAITSWGSRQWESNPHLRGGNPVLARRAMPAGRESDGNRTRTSALATQDSTVEPRSRSSFAKGSGWDSNPLPPAY